MKTEIVILPTNNSIITLNTINNRLILDIENILPNNGISQHFYLIDTKARITLNDYYYTRKTNQVFKAYCDSLVEGANNSSNCFKIIVTTNKSLIVGDCYYCNRGDELDINCMSHFFGDDAARCQKSKLPQLSHNSIQLLINYYNKYKVMPESVEVKDIIAPIYGNNGSVYPIIYIPKLNNQSEVDITIPEVRENLKSLFKQKEAIEAKIRNIDKMALIEYEGNN